MLAVFLVVRKRASLARLSWKERHFSPTGCVYLNSDTLGSTFLKTSSYWVETEILKLQSVNVETETAFSVHFIPRSNFTDGI